MIKTQTVQNVMATECSTCGGNHREGVGVPDPDGLPVTRTTACWWRLRDQL